MLNISHTLFVYLFTLFCIPIQLKLYCHMCVMRLKNNFKTLSFVFFFGTLCKITLMVNYISQYIWPGLIIYYVQLFEDYNNLSNLGFVCNSVHIISTYRVVDPDYGAHTQNRDCTRGLMKKGNKGLRSVFVISGILMRPNLCR